MSQLKATFSIRPTDVDAAYEVANAMMGDIVAKYPGYRQNRPPQPPAQAPHPAQAIPLNAANLQQQQQALNKQNQKIHNRSGSHSSRPPAAPTSAHAPSFPASTDNSVPHYFEPEPKVTQETLRLPPNKKPKVSASSTPQLGQATPGSNASPPLNKARSPEMKRQPTSDQIKIEDTRAVFACPELDCDSHFDGFENQAELEKHRLEEHIQPLLNPAQYALTEFATILGLEADGKPIKTETTDAPVAPKVAASTSQQTKPVIKPGATPTGTGLTPMDRQSSALGKASPAMPKDKVDVQQPPTTKEPAPIENLWQNASVNPMDLLQNFQGIDSAANGAISDMSVYRSITPNDTPESSKDGASEPNSDISENIDLTINLDILDDSWNPFGEMNDFNGLNGLNDIDEFLALNKVSVADEDMAMNMGMNPSGNMFDDLTNYDANQSWDDFGDANMLEKPFNFDTSGFSFNSDLL
jgi:hypothetical protein